MNNKARRLRELRVHRDVDDIIGLGNVARYDDEIAPIQLDEVVVKPSDFGGVVGRVSSDEVNDRVRRAYRNRASGAVRDSQRRRNNSAKELANVLLQGAIKEDEEHPNYPDETIRRSTSYPYLWADNSGDYHIGKTDMINGFSSPMEIVSPEFDLLPYKDLYKSGKQLYRMARATKSYTGVPSYYIDSFVNRGGRIVPKQKFNVFTTPDVRIAESYSKGGTRAMKTGLNGRVFKVYADKGNRVLKVDPPTKGTYYMDRRMPFLYDEKAGKIVKSKHLIYQKLDGLGKITEQGAGRISEDYLQQLKKETDPRFMGLASNELNKLKREISDGYAVIVPEEEFQTVSVIPRTDNLIATAKELKYDGVEIPDIIDGSYYDPTTSSLKLPPFTERIYGDPSKLKFAPVDESFAKTYMMHYGDLLGSGLLKGATGYGLDSMSKRFGGRVVARGGTKRRMRNKVTTDLANRGLTPLERVQYGLSYPLRIVSKNVMQYAQAVADHTGKDDVALKEIKCPNSPRNNYLVQMGLADIAMRKAGWLRGLKGDYGPIRNYVRNSFGELPVYQQNKDYDNITRDDLVAFGNITKRFSEAGGNFVRVRKRIALPDPGIATTSFYIDPYTNKLYQKQWDIEKFGSGDSYNRSYSDIKQLGARWLDRIGHPMMLTTGFQPISRITFSEEGKPIYGKHYSLDDLLEFNSGDEKELPDYFYRDLLLVKDAMDEFMSSRKVDSNPDNNGLFVIKDVDGTGRNAYGMRQLNVVAKDMSKRNNKQFGGGQRVYRDRFVGGRGV